MPAEPSRASQAALQPAFSLPKSVPSRLPAKIPNLQGLPPSAGTRDGRDRSAGIPPLQSLRHHGANASRHPPDNPPAAASAANRKLGPAAPAAKFESASKSRVGASGEPRRNARHAVENSVASGKEKQVATSKFSRDECGRLRQVLGQQAC